MFNKSFYQPNTSATKEMAEERLLSLGYKNFSFKNSSFSNGASFYFEGEDGKEIRVSDHPLTGKRAFLTVQVSLTEMKPKPITPLTARKMYASGEISKKEYRTICKENGFIFNP